MTKLELFQDPLCPFCMRVKSFMSSVNIDIPMRNTMQDIQAYKDLTRGGGRPTVPCLRIESEDGEVRWLYESLDIIEYLRKLNS